MIIALKPFTFFAVWKIILSLENDVKEYYVEPKGGKQAITSGTISTYARSRMTCFSACFESYSCKSSGFNKYTKECELYNEHSSPILAGGWSLMIANINDCASNPCLNSGTCTDGDNSYTCTCISGYEGLYCDVDTDECSSNPCLNGGTCTDEVNGYTCTCVPGYEGVECAINTDECSSNPCLNGGTCTDEVNGYTCTCVPGYEGVECVINTNECSSNPCLNGGTCIDQVNSYTCNCGSSYIGSQCQTEYDDK
ncbi:unnamed protein product [Owenia fusiformis]|uniref:EGF-like domain-containing protein n=1 Tax=Owenia fusiformis TaxID=6347 RepID=A0A8S4PXY0_OWEFU|nr:unnamed protein product [Owenia fusiformis]